MCTRGGLLTAILLIIISAFRGISSSGHAGGGGGGTGASSSNSKNNMSNILSYLIRNYNYLSAERRNELDKIMKQLSENANKASLGVQNHAQRLEHMQQKCEESKERFQEAAVMASNIDRKRDKLTEDWNRTFDEIRDRVSFDGGGYINHRDHAVIADLYNKIYAPDVNEVFSAFHLFNSDKSLQDDFVKVVQQIRDKTYNPLPGTDLVEQMVSAIRLYKEGAGHYSGSSGDTRDKKESNNRTRPSAFRSSSERHWNRRFDRWIGRSGSGEWDWNGKTGLSCPGSPSARPPSSQRQSSTKSQESRSSSTIGCSSNLFSECFSPGKQLISPPDSPYVPYRRTHRDDLPPLPPPSPSPSVRSESSSRRTGKKLQWPPVFSGKWKGKQFFSKFFEKRKKKPGMQDLSDEAESSWVGAHVRSMSFQPEMLSGYDFAEMAMADRREPRSAADILKAFKEDTLKNSLMSSAEESENYENEMGKNEIVELEEKQKEVELQVEDRICAICLELLTYTPVNVLLCSHKFHHGCLTQWNRQEPSCPVCRKFMKWEDCIRYKNDDDDLLL